MQENSAPYLVSFQDQTTVHPVGLLALVVCCASILFLPRRTAIVPILVLLCFIPSAQRVVILGLDFTFTRIAIVAGFMRILMKSEYGKLRWRAPDTILVVWAIVESIAYVSLHGDFSSFIFISGQMFDALGSYFLFRTLVRGLPDVMLVARAFALLAIPVALLFLIEKATGRNLFGIFGGVPFLTMVREGRLRCQGAFPHPILAGTFWASVLPLIGALYFSKRTRRLALVGTASGLLIIFLCASSTPIGTTALAVFGACIVPWRRFLPLMRVGAVVMLCGLHAVMKQPVWHLLSRIDLTGGSDGYHRFLLVDRAIAFFSEWAANGTLDTAHWGWGLEDVTNQYVLEGVRGGALTLALFITMLVMCFSRVGRTSRALVGDKPAFAMAWALGLALMVHAANFVAVSYFGQVTVGWYLTLALIVSLHQSLSTHRAAIPTAMPRPTTEPLPRAPAGGRLAH